MGRSKWGVLAGAGIVILAACDGDSAAVGGGGGGRGDSASSAVASGSQGSSGSSSAKGGGGEGGGGVYVPPGCPAGSNANLPPGAPALQTDVWTEISPPNVPFDSQATAITQGMTIDPCNPATVYVCVGDVESGVYKSSDGGATWTELGDFRFPVNVRVDPRDPQHLYVGDGVRGGANGFFVTTDGGATWEIPQSFRDFVDAGGTYDVYHVEPDPTDFDHVLVSFHSSWADNQNGIIESHDGGNTFTRHEIVQGDVGGGCDVYFLYEPELGIGNASTWLFGTQGQGHWKTTDAGATWTQVTTVNMQHGGGTIYYTREGTLYMSSAEGILRSDDNGDSFTNVLGGAYLSVVGDGTRLWTGTHFNARFLTALEDDDTEWTEFNMQDFDEGPFQMALDEVNGVLYSANIRAGVWALKLE